MKFWKQLIDYTSTNSYPNILLSKDKEHIKKPRFYTGSLTVKLHPISPHIKVNYTKTTQFLYKRYNTVLEHYKNINHSLQHPVTLVIHTKKPYLGPNVSSCINNTLSYKELRNDYNLDYKLEI